MRKSLIIVVIMIVLIGGMIATSLPAKGNDVEATYVETELPETEVEGEFEVIPEDTFTVHDGSVEWYRGDELYWAWDNTQLSDDAVVTMLSEHNWLFVAQDGHRVWLLRRETIELVAENGYYFSHGFYEDMAEAAWIVQEDGSLEYVMLYPYCEDYCEPIPVPVDVKVAEIYDRALKDQSGDWYAYRYDGWRTMPEIGEEHAIKFETFRLGKGRVLDSDIERIQGGDGWRYLDDFQNKYNMHDFW